MSEDLMRANKVTVYWGEGGVAIGTFYKTHEKIAVIKSTDEEVINAGFVMPEGTDEAPVTAQQKLEAYKTFLMTNAATFGIMYDPVDRRADEFKYPNKYDEGSFKQYSRDILAKTIQATLEKVQNNVIASLVKQGALTDGTTVDFGISDDAEVEIAEVYSNGSLKYATAKYDVVIGIGATSAQTSGVVSLVSGQLKKPRELADAVLTMTGIKTFLIDNDVLPKIEKKSNTEDTDEVDETAEPNDAEYPVED